MFGGIEYKPSDYRILMNIIPMMNEVLNVADSMIGESAPPDFRVAPHERAEFVRVRALDELDGAFDGHARSRGKQEMDMIGHSNEGMQRVAPFAAVVRKSFEEQSGIVFDNEQSSIMPGAELRSTFREAR
jgi:hypothetical protein